MNFKFKKQLKADMAALAERMRRPWRDYKASMKQGGKKT